MYLRKFALIALFSLMGTSLSALDQAETGQSHIDIPSLIQNSSTIDESGLKERLLSWYRSLPEDKKDILNKSIEIIAYTSLSQISEIIVDFAPNGDTFLPLSIFTALTVGQKIGFLLNKVSFRKVPLLNKFPAVARGLFSVTGYLSCFTFNKLAYPPIFHAVAYQFLTAFIVTIGLELAQHLRIARNIPQ